jgi:hypothetical protein
VVFVKEGSVFDQFATTLHPGVCVIHPLQATEPRMGVTLAQHALQHRQSFRLSHSTEDEPKRGSDGSEYYNKRARWQNEWT